MAGRDAYPGPDAHPVAWDPSNLPVFQCTAAEGPPVPGQEPMDFDGWREVAPVARLAPRGLSGLLSRDSSAAYQPLDTSTYPPNYVLINVYDIGDSEILQKINKMSTVNDKVLIGGIYHAGVEIYGAEWGYGFTDQEDSGVYAVPPRCASQHTYRVTCPLGPSELSEDEVEAAVMRLRDKWRGTDYQLLHHNCLDFCNALCAELGVGRIPGWIDRFGRTASSLDNFRHRVGSGVSQTKQLARTVSTDVEQMLRGVRGDVGEAARRDVPRIAQAARREVPRIAEAARTEIPKIAASAQTLGASVGRWGRGLLGAAARALGDDQASRERRGRLRQQARAEPPEGEETLRNALRNRGGLRVAARGGRGHPDAAARRRAPGRAPAGEEADDAFLLDGLPLPGDAEEETPISAPGGAEAAALPAAESAASSTAEAPASQPSAALAEQVEAVEAGSAPAGSSAPAPPVEGNAAVADGAAEGNAAVADGAAESGVAAASGAAADGVAAESSGSDAAGVVADGSGAPTAEEEIGAEAEAGESDELERVDEQPLEAVAEEDEPPLAEQKETSAGPRQEQAAPRELSPDSEWTLLDVDGR